MGGLTLVISNTNRKGFSSNLDPTVIRLKDGKQQLLLYPALHSYLHRADFGVTVTVSLRNMLFILFIYEFYFFETLKTIKW